jgi:transposase
MRRRDYPSDVSNAEWKILEPLIPPAKEGGRPRTTDMREVLNAMFYVDRTGCQWRALPHDFPRLSHGLELFPHLAQRRDLATDAYRFARAGACEDGPRADTQRGDY